MAKRSVPPKPALPPKSDPTPLATAASERAPIIYTDGALTWGVLNGVGNVTLEAVRWTHDGQKTVEERVVVAHLRMSLHAAQSLQHAFSELMLLAQRSQGSAD